MEKEDLDLNEGLRNQEEKSKESKKDHEKMLKKKHLRDNQESDDSDLDSEEIDLIRQNEKNEKMLEQITRGIENFVVLYNEFLKNPDYKTLNKKINNNINYVCENIHKFSEMYHFAKKFKDYYQMIGENKLQPFIQERKLYSTYKEARKDFDDYLYHFLETEKIKNEKKITHLSANTIKEISDYDPKYLKEVPIIYAKDNQEDITQQIQESLKYDLVILRGFIDKFGFDNKYFTTDYIASTFPNQEIEVIEQPDSVGFNIKSTRQVWNVKDYTDYLKNKRNGNLEEKDSKKGSNGTSSEEENNYISKKNKKQKKSEIADNKIELKPDQIYFGVNIDMDSMEEVSKELMEKIHPIFSTCSFYDCMSYLRNSIKGMTCSQFYFKNEGAWTGPHEENLRMRSININHGNNCENGDSEWYGIELAELPNFYKHFEKHHKSHYIQNEGCWFEDYKYFLKNKIPYLYGIQKPGDIIIVGVGCIHWVKSRGYSVHSSWNFCTKELVQFKSGMERYFLNKKFGNPNLIPMYTLMLDLLNFELYNLDIELVKFCYNHLEQEIKKTNSEFDCLINVPKFKKVSVDIEPEQYEALFCEFCHDEIFNGWGYCNNCKESADRKSDVILCVKCFKNHFGKCWDKSTPYLFYKYYDFDLEKFLGRCRNRINGTFEENGMKVQYELTKRNDFTKNNAQKKADWIKNNLLINENAADNTIMSHIYDNLNNFSTFNLSEDYRAKYENSEEDIWKNNNIDNVINTEKYKSFISKIKETLGVNLKNHKEGNSISLVDNSISEEKNLNSLNEKCIAKRNNEVAKKTYKAPVKSFFKIKEKILSELNDEILIFHENIEKNYLKGNDISQLLKDLFEKLHEIVNHKKINSDKHKTIMFVNYLDYLTYNKKICLKDREDITVLLTKFKSNYSLK